MSERTYDLEERTFQFAVSILVFVRTLPRNNVTLELVGQLVRSASSIGANYCEANEAESKNDFIHKLAICRKEAHETYFWLRLLAATVPAVKHHVEVLRQEAKELSLIFNSIIKKTKNIKLSI